MSREAVRFVRRGRVVELRDFAPTETLLDHLRLRARAHGTKEGCAEGDCGACTVAVGRLRAGRLVYEPVNSCIQLLGMMDGAEVVTVDDLAPSSDRLHPVQRALVDAHASQCGFCTPGFVMSLFTLYHSGARADRATVNDWLAGNLCRCTGYRPIADAALACCTGEAADAYAERASGTAALLGTIADDADLFAGDDDTFFAAPATEDALAALCARYPDATVVGGATDVGLWITKQLRALPRIVHTGRVASLHAVREMGDRVEIGAAATCAEAEGALRGIDPDVGEMLRRFGSKQVRAAGTVGGNIANGSPIGDSPPVLIALGASIELRHRDARRMLALEDFFTGYGRQDRAPRRDPHPHRRAAAWPGRALPLLQDIETIRPGYLRPARRVPFPNRERPRRRSAHRLRRHGRHPETRPPRRARRRRPRPARPRFLARRRRSPRRGLLPHRTTTARAPATACASRRPCS